MAKTKQKKVNPYAKQPEKKKRWPLVVALVVVLCAALCVGLYGLLGGESEPKVEYLTGTHYVEIDVKDYGVIKAELYADIAPITVTNFMKLVNEGFYNNLTFHRIISGFMIQGGDPLGTGRGGSDEKITGEFKANGITNNLSHVRGVISMARAQNFNSASSQFFIMHKDSTGLDGQYAAFGKVLEGMEVVDAICASTPVEDNNGTVLAANQPVINSIRVIEQP